MATDPPRRPGRTPTRAALGIVVLAIAMVVAAGCGGGSTTDPDRTTTTTTPEGLQFPAYADPATPIAVEAGRRFAIILPAEPAAGWHWVMGPIDTAIAIPLGSEFRDDETLLSRTITSLTSTTTLAPTTTTPLDPAGPADTTTSTTTASIPVVQVQSFVGRAPGTTTISLRYERIGSVEPAPNVVVFTVEVTPLTSTTTR